jgi:hypothetical protein
MPNQEGCIKANVPPTWCWISADALAVCPTVPSSVRKSINVHNTLNMHNVKEHAEYANGLHIVHIRHILYIAHVRHV